MKIKVIDGCGYQMDTVSQTHDPLDGKPLLNQYGEPLHGFKPLKNGAIIDVKLTKLTQEQKDFHGYNDSYNWVYFVD